MQSGQDGERTQLYKRERLHRIALDLDRLSADHRLAFLHLAQVQQHEHVKEHVEVGRRTTIGGEKALAKHARARALGERLVDGEEAPAKHGRDSWMQNLALNNTMPWTELRDAWP